MIDTSPTFNVDDKRIAERIEARHASKTDSAIALFDRIDSYVRQIASFYTDSKSAEKIIRERMLSSSPSHKQLESQLYRIEKLFGTQELAYQRRLKNGVSNDVSLLEIELSGPVRESRSTEFGVSSKKFSLSDYELDSTFYGR
tara:strand:+ start:769 stop:1197 length:429 start_codon:yes stop_codon:yes gene_type:complete